MLGGPSPRLGGKLTTLMSVHISTHLYHNLLLVRSHFGTTPNGKSFDKYLGEEGYRQHIEMTFDNFLHASFSKFVDTMYIMITYFNSLPGTEECNDCSLYSASKEVRNKEVLKRVDDNLREKYRDVCFELSKTKTKTPHMKKEASEGQCHISARLNVAGQR